LYLKASFRIFLSLIISILITGLLTFLFYTNLFPYLEKEFYTVRQVAVIQNILEQSLDQLKTYHLENTTRLKELILENSIREAWRPIQERAVIENREKVVAQFLSRYRGASGIQIFDPERRRIQYSTLRGDILTQDNNRIAYRPPNTLTPPLDPKILNREFFGIYYDAARRSLGYVESVRDLSNFEIAIINLLISTDDFGQRLFQEKLIGRFDLVNLFDSNGLVLILSNVPIASFQTQIEELLTRDELAPITSLTSDEMDAVLISLKTPFGRGGALITPDYLKLPDVAQMIIVVSFSASVFLLMLLLTGARADPEAVFRLRLKSLKIQILQDILRSGEDFTAEKLAGELRRNGVIWKRTLKQALGHLPKRKRKEYEELIEKSWDEILTVLEPKVATGQIHLDTQRLENLIRESMAKIQIVAQTSPAVKPTSAVVPLPKDVMPAKAPATEKIQEAEPVEELEEIEEAEPADADAEPVEAEPVEELEEIAEAEPADAATDAAAELVEAEPVEELEEIAEAEPADAATDAAAELVEAEPVEELEEIAEAEPADAATDAAAELVEAEPVEELEEIAEAEPADAATDAAAELVEAEPVEELEEIAEAEPADAATDTAAELVEAEPVEEEALEELESPTNDQDAPVPAEYVDPYQEPGYFLTADAWKVFKSEEPVDDLKPVDRYEELEIVEETEEPSFIEHFGPVELTALYQPIEGDAFEDEDGLPVLRQDFLNKPRQGKDPNLASMVSQLMGEVEDFSLEDETQETDRYWSWTPRGFDFDEFLMAYPQNEVGIFKALVDLSREFSCFAAALLMPKAKQLAAEYTVGFTPKGKSQLFVPLGSALNRNYLAKGGITIMETHGLPKDFLDKLLDKRDHAIVKTLLFIPLLYQERTIYLFMVSSRRRRDWLNVLRPQVKPARQLNLYLEEEN
jgi:hypothetical protein